MLGIKTSIVSLFFAAATLAVAAESEYFPLQQGNSWVFRSANRGGAGGQSIEVRGAETIAGQSYTKVDFFGRPIYLRHADGVLLANDPERHDEKTWLSFGAEIGESTASEIEPCVQSARVVSREARVATRAGEWNNAALFTFESSCADAGVTQMYFVPGIGPVVYETTSIAGPVRWELIYSRSGANSVEAANVSATVALDSPSYKASETLKLQVRFTIRNTHTEPVRLQFSSGQRYDLRIRNEEGTIGYSWSADKLFIQETRTEDLIGERTYTFEATPTNLELGRYVAEVWLTTRTPSYAGTVAFEVTR